MRQYFSHRKHGIAPLTLDQTKTLFESALVDFNQKHLFLEHFGGSYRRRSYTGKAGSDVSAYALLQIHKEGLWPIYDNLWHYSEEDLFDIIEFLHEHASVPEIADLFDGEQPTGQYDRPTGQLEMRLRLNPVLQAYGNGFELTEAGRVESAGEAGMKELLSAQLPTEDARIKQRIENAINLFRDRHSDEAARRVSISELVDVCELLRPQIEAAMLTKDENELFRIANGFGLRHLNDLQRTDYSPAWQSWLFYLFLSTIHLTVRLTERKQTESVSPEDDPSHIS